MVNKFDKEDRLENIKIIILIHYDNYSLINILKYLPLVKSIEAFIFLLFTI